MAKPKHNGHLQLDPKNARRHSPRNQALIRQSLETVGAGRSILADANGIVRAGNGVFEQAQALGIPVKVVESDGKSLIAVKRTDLKGKAAIRAAMLDNLAADSSYADYDAEILAEIARDDELIAALAREDKAISALLAKAEPQAEKVDAGELVDRADSLQDKWRVQVGDLYAISEHRLLCADSTDEDAVARLMDGKKANMVFTDPPWNVDYQGGTKKRKQLQNDNVEIGWDDWLTSALANVNGYAVENCPAYVFFGLMRAGDTQLGIGAAGWRICQTLVWVKQHAQFGNFRAQYKYQHEPFYYCSIGKKMPKWYGANNEVSVWQIDRASRNDWHPTQKPPELARRAILNSTGGDGVVVDLFTGSGSTLVACEQTGRHGFGMEIEPKYCSVTLERLSNLGLTPRKVDK